MYTNIIILFKKKKKIDILSEILPETVYIMFSTP